MRESYPRIQTTLETEGQKAIVPFYLSGIEKIMHHLLPPHFFVGSDITQKLERQLPIICWSSMQEPPFEMSFFLCSQFRPDAFLFFYDMITRWLIPGKKLNAPLQFATEFIMPEINAQKYIAGQVCVKIETAEDIEKLQKNLPIIEKEIRLGVNSSYQASRILEIKGLSSDKKTALIQENLMILIKRRPQHFDYDLLSEMQHFLLLCKDEFKMERNYRHLSRIIAVIYLFEKSLTLSHEAYLNKRLVTVKMMRQSVGNKKNVVLGIVLAISFLQENERLEGNHIASAVRKLIKNTTFVKGSFFSKSSHSSKAHVFYIEVEKKENYPFKKNELELLQDSLGDEVKAHIEQSINLMFMPDNEEIILRNILTLSGQLKFVRDLPQVMITFKQQIGDKLEFLVVLLRVLKPSSIPIAHFFDLDESKLEFFFDRSKHVGYLRKKYSKEANVFCIQILKSPFLRQDQSVDLYKARELVAKELRHILGDFRDYNGGYLSKEREVFHLLMQLLGSVAKKHAFLLENFFYSITPISLRTTIEIGVLKMLFEMTLQAKEEEVKEYSFYLKEIHHHCCILIVDLKPLLVKLILKSINNLKFEKDRFAYFSLQEGDRFYFGLLLQNASREDVTHLRLALEKKLHHFFYI